MKGTSKGPKAILDVAYQVEMFDEETHAETYSKGIVVLPEIPPAASPEEEATRIYETVKRYDLFNPANKRIPIILGGEHSITPPVVRAAADAIPNLSVLQFDAHADLRDSYTAGRNSHACAMRRVLDIVNVKQVVQVGIRSFSEDEYTQRREQFQNIITPEYLEDNFDAACDFIDKRLTNDVYITVDIDAFDPSFAPGTGTPEPGGLNWRQVTRILRQVCKSKHVIGFDVVEVSPLGNGNVITEYLAARLVEKFIAYMG
jgi:agmatinase